MNSKPATMKKASLLGNVLTFVLLVAALGTIAALTLLPFVAGAAEHFKGAVR